MTRGEPGQRASKGAFAPLRGDLVLITPRRRANRKLKPCTCNSRLKIESPPKRPKHTPVENFSLRTDYSDYSIRTWASFTTPVAI